MVSGDPCRVRCSLRGLGEGFFEDGLEAVGGVGAGLLDQHQSSLLGTYGELVSSVPISGDQWRFAFHNSCLCSSRMKVGQDKSFPLQFALVAKVEQIAD